MNKPTIFAVSLLLLIGCKKKEEPKPNILFILADDLGWADLGCYGSEFYETPNLDALAHDGMRFTQAYAACPVCSPTRASIMTGKYPARGNTTDWFGAPQPDEVPGHHTRNKPLLPAPYLEYMDLEEHTIAEALREAGYHTFFAGKWHLGDTGYFPEDQGFGINKGGHHRGSPPGGYFSPYKNPKLSDGPEGEHLPIRLAEETNSFIEKHREGPFFAYLSFYSVHTPLQAHAELVNIYERKKFERGFLDQWGEEGERKVRLVQCHPTYAAMVESMDKAVGMVIDQLKTLGLYDNTVIFFMSDNGGLSTSEGHPTSNLPLRAGKGWLYEGGVREPCMVHWPGVTPDHSVSEEVITSTDFYPTLLEIAGISPDASQHKDGKSFVPVLKTEAYERGAIYWHYPHYGNQGSSPGSAIREGDWKLIKWYENDSLELYNLAEDIGERNNLINQESGKAQELLEKLELWLVEVEARFPTSNPDVGS